MPKQELWSYHCGWCNKTLIRDALTKEEAEAVGRAHSGACYLQFHAEVMNRILNDGTDN